MSPHSLQSTQAIVRWVSRGVTMIAITVFIYGMIRYPDAPISAQDGKFLGKQGQPHTRVDFEEFSHWERALWIAWPAMFAMFAVRYSIEPSWRNQTGTWKDI